MVRREVSIPSFFFFCGGVAFLASALSTQYWVKSAPQNNKNNETLKGCLHFGLFKGSRALASFINDKMDTVQLSVRCSSEEGVCMFVEGEDSDQRELELQLNINAIAEARPNSTGHLANVKLLPLASWASSLVFLSLALVMGLVGAVFSVINSVMTPLDFITGLQGLWLWSAIGAAFSLVCAALWGAAFDSSLKENVLSVTQLKEGWDSSGGRTRLGHSFWFVVVACLLYSANVACVLALLHKPWRRNPNASRVGNDIGLKSQDDMMY